MGSWAPLAWTILGVVLISGTQAQQDIQIAEFICGTDQSGYRQANYSGQPISSICRNGSKIIVKNVGQGAQSQTVNVRLMYGELCYMDPDPTKTAAFGSPIEVSGLNAGENRTIDIDTWTLPISPKCGISCLMAVVTVRDDPNALPTYQSKQMMTKCDTHGVDLRLEAHVTMDDFTVRIQHGMTIGEAFENIPTNGSGTFNLTLVIDNIGTRDLPEFTVLSQPVLATYLARVTPDRNFDDHGDCHRRDMERNIKFNDTMVSGGVFRIGALAANSTQRVVITTETLKQAKLDFSQNGRCIMCGVVALVAAVDPLHMIDDNNRCNNYQHARGEIDCTLGDIAMGGHKRNVLLYPDVIYNGHNAVLKYCDGGTQIKTYEIRVSLLDYKVQWERKDWDIGTQMGWAKLFVLEEMFLKFVTHQNMNLTNTICEKIEDQLSFDELSKDDDIYILPSASSRMRRSASDEEQRIKWRVNLHGLAHNFTHSPRETMDKINEVLRAEKIPEERADKIRRRLLAVLPDIARVTSPNDNRTEMEKYLDFGNATTGRCPKKSLYPFGMFKQSMKIYMMTGADMRFNDPLDEGPGINCATRFLRQFYNGGLGHIGLKDVMGYFKNQTWYGTNLTPQYDHMIDPYLLQNCPKNDIFKPVALPPMYWTERDGKIYHGVKGMYTGKLLWKRVGVLSCDSCRPRGTYPKTSPKTSWP